MDPHRSNRSTYFPNRLINRNTIMDEWIKSIMARSLAILSVVTIARLMGTHHRRQIDTTDTAGQHHDAHHTYSMQFASLICGCEPLFSRMSKRARESFAALARAKQKSVHCTAMIARKMNDNDADMDCQAVLTPDYKAGGDSKRGELCRQDPQKITLTTTGASSSSGRIIQLLGVR